MTSLATLLVPDFADSVLLPFFVFFIFNLLFRHVASIPNGMHHLPGPYIHMFLGPNMLVNLSTVPLLTFFQAGAGLRESWVRKQWDDAKILALTTVKVNSNSKNNVPSPEHDD
jgi:hypothetical protein